MFIDDIGVHHADIAEHQQMVQQVLAKLKAHSLCLKLEKCEFERSSIKFLGMVIGNGTVDMDPKKVEVVTAWPVPTTKKQLQQFLGLVNFYRRFVKGFASIARPLHDLTGGTPWTWESKHQEAFEWLKCALAEAPVLAMPDEDLPYRVETDASDYAIGVVLSQKGTDGHYHPVEFHSWTLEPSEWNYQIYDKELLAIVDALSLWWQYLLGAKHIFEIWTDHLNLLFYRQPQNLTRRQAHWITDLREFNFTIHHLPGKYNGRADALSRQPDFVPKDPDNQAMLGLPEELFRTTEVTLDGPVDWIEEIRHNTDWTRDPVLEQAQGNPKWKRLPEGTALHGGRLYVPATGNLRDRIIQAHHDQALAGHPGARRTTLILKRHYWWDTLDGDVSRYVSGCQLCQWTKPSRDRPTGLLHPNPVPERPWEAISWDLIGPLPESRGFNAILTIVDKFSKTPYFIPTRTELTAEGAARLLLDNVIRLHGLPWKIYSDRGPQFLSRFMKELYRLLSMEGAPSTAYHPQTNGQAERMNQEVEQFLRLYVEYRQADWADKLALAELAISNRDSSATGRSPFFINHGFHPYLGKEPPFTSNNDRAKGFADELAQAH